jgi:para-nitrobenzyl esterase
VSVKQDHGRPRAIRVGALILLLLSLILVLSALMAETGTASPGSAGVAHPRGLAATTGSVLAGAPSPSAVIATTHGKVRGLTVTADGYPTYQTFFGIRYGQDTGGDNRWLPPKPANWKGVFDASTFGPIAPQSVINGDGDPDPARMNEDCLRLNIWTPKADRQKRAVVVYIHGGGYTLGNPNGSWYSGKRFAQDNVVYVDMAYRLGPWGFMDVGYLPGAPKQYKASGNLGLLDQRLALKWVHDNIAKFGGDPERVTIAGQSAGGWSDTIHLALPQSNKYFQRCIAMSGAMQVGDVDWAKQVAQWTMEAAGVTTFDEMKDLTVQQLNDAQDAVYTKYDYNWWCMLYRPIVDGITIKQDPKKSIRQGVGKNIPVMTGTTADELNYWLRWVDWGTLWGNDEATIPTLCSDIKAHGFRDLVYERMVVHAIDESGKTPQQIEDEYVASHPGSTKFQAFMNMLDDLTFRLPVTRLVENRLAAPGHKDNNYVYVFDWDSQDYYGNGTYPNDDPRAYQAAAYHAAEVGFAFGIPEEWSYGPWKEFAPYVPGHIGELYYGTWYPEMTWPSQLVPQLHRTWLQFIKTGDPNNRNIPHWPTYRPSTGRETLVFNTVPSVVSDWQGTDRALWNGVKGDPLYDCPTGTALTP